jgi:hypothetical protein
LPQISKDTAPRLACNFATTPKFWVNLQFVYDLEMAKETPPDRVNAPVNSRAAYAIQLPSRNVRPGVLSPVSIIPRQHPQRRHQNPLTAR